MEEALKQERAGGAEEGDGKKNEPHRMLDRKETWRIRDSWGKPGAAFWGLEVGEALKARRRTPAGGSAEGGT